jgi:hypothetical protein
LSRASFRYAAESGVAPSVTVITETAGKSRLDDVTQSLLAQSLQSWELILIGDDAATTSADPRIRAVSSPVRARAISDALNAAAAFVVYLGPHEMLAPTTLEKWAWFLDANRSARAVTGGTHSPHGLMARKADIQELGGLDAAYEELAASAERVAYTGGWTGKPEDPDRWLSITDDANAWLPESAPFANRLLKSRPRLLFVAPWMTMGGADIVALDMLRQLRGAGWELTVATTLLGDHRLLPAYFRSPTSYLCSTTLAFFVTWSPVEAPTWC